MGSVRLSTQPYKGTRDFYPAEMKLRNWFFGKAKKILTLCAYDEYDGPMLEPLSLYIAKSGEEIANQQTYNFVDKGGHHLAVRPEMTPTVARMIAGKISELNMPLRWFSIPNLYRYERPQRGRLREHWQINVDIFGCESYEADLEIINLAVMFLEAFNADTSMFQVRINNRRFFNDVLFTIGGLDPENLVKVSKLVDRKNKIPKEVYIKELIDIGLSMEKVDKIESVYTMTVDEATAICPESKGAVELNELYTGFKALHIDQYCVFDFSIVRGFEYYTGTVFEVFDTAPENTRSMFGGGRYDNLVGHFIDTNVPGVGFGFGDVTLQNFLETHNLIPDLNTAKQKVLIARFPEVSYEKYTEFGAILRESNIVNSIYIGNKKLKDQLRYAVKEGFSHILFFGGREMDSDIVVIKNLATQESLELPASSFTSCFTSSFELN